MHTPILFKENKSQNSNKPLGFFFSGGQWREWSVKERGKKRDWKKEVGKEKEMTEIEILNN